MKIVTKEEVKVDAGTKMLETALLGTSAELRLRAWARLRKKGVSVPAEHRAAVDASFTVALREPYTVCWLMADYDAHFLTGIGVAKRNPIDRRNLSVGATIAVYRAWRDFWTQAARLETGTESGPVVVPARPVGEIAEGELLSAWGLDAGGMYVKSEAVETLERVREVVAETPF